MQSLSLLLLNRSEAGTSACEEESLNAEKVLLLIKNSCEGLNAQSLTELTNAITSEDIYKNVPSEITTLITQAIKQMKGTNGTTNFSLLFECIYFRATGMCVINVSR